MPSMPGMRTSETTHPKSTPGSASRKCWADSNSVTSKSAAPSRKSSEIAHRLVVVDDIDLSPMRHLSNSRLMRQAV